MSNWYWCSPQMHIAIMETKFAIAGETDLMAALKKAMAATRDHWMCTNEDERFRAAIGGVMLHFGEGSDEFRRLQSEMSQLNRFSAALQATQVGVAVDFGKTIGDLVAEQELEKPIGLLALWKQHDRV